MTYKVFITRLPTLLILVRVLLAPLVFLLAENKSCVLILWVVLSAAFLSDVFDGVIARRLGVVTASLRVADSRADIWFYGWAAAAVCIAQPLLVRHLRVPLIAVLVLQMISYLLAWMHYGRIASFHAYSAKLWGLTLFLAAAFLLTSHYGLPFLWAAIGMGVASNVEGIAMILILPIWQHDVKGITHALYIRRTEGLR